MGFLDLPFMLKAFRFRRLVVEDGKRRKKKKPSWLTPVSHGYYTVDRLSNTENSSNDDSVFVQREQQSEELERWFFGVSKSERGKEIVKYMQNHLFDNIPNELGIMRKCKETMRRAYVEEERSGVSAASVMVVNGEKIAMASIGGHRVVVCRDGEAHQIRDKNRKSSKHWSQFIFPVCNQEDKEDESDTRNSELVVITEKINSDTEFIIIGSSGIWEVMKNQEAINLIRHIEDPKEAAKCLAKEALNRISKSSISCVVIRFD
ncbi:PPM-type phosphatase domain superfamily [Arabidopsis thaliana x Arabidopsis arenosa]|uniref:PPM-type phosphatase domain superfamily n=1 Tax=Arabidopsis thaliana x Arabidopsis arenosa TaxID=1240361 RepID=A0A8T2AW11_9BRAS|nr:PPM-type phosphatase domain superfamily [Arabidopsis thaliana x Arabidopsis arenosa]